jgi:Flp pilus assembly protein TadB
VSSSLVFLLGAVLMAALGSALLWLLSRPRNRTADPDEFRRTLRNMSRHSRTGFHSRSAVRVIGRVEVDDDGEEPT